MSDDGMSVAAPPTAAVVAHPSSSSSSRPPLKVLGERGLWLSHATSIPARFRRTFPGRRSRQAALIAAVVAVGLAAAWTATTVQNRWISDIHHPVTTLTMTPLPSVPALPGLMTIWQANYWWNQTLENTLNLQLDATINPRTPEPTYTTPEPIPEHGYKFYEIFMKVSAEDVVARGSFITPLTSMTCGTASDFSKTIMQTDFCIPDNWADVMAGRAEWPLWFNSTLDNICIRTYSYLDPRALVEVDSFDGNTTNRINFNRQRFENPFQFVALMDLSTLQVVGQESSLDKITTANLWSRPIVLPYGHRHFITSRMSKRITAEGEESWHTDLEFAGSLKLREAIIEEAFDDFLAANPDLHAVLLADPNLQLNRSAWNATQQHYIETCFGPSSLQVSVVHESHVYGFFAFASDVGGMLSILSIAFALAFPLAQRLVIPRQFIGAVFLAFLKRACGEPTANADDASSSSDEEESDDETDGTVTPAEGHKRNRKGSGSGYSSDAGSELRMRERDDHDDAHTPPASSYKAPSIALVSSSLHRSSSLASAQVSLLEAQL